MHTEKKPPSEIDCAIAQKVAALSNGATLGLPTGGVMGLETDMSFVFLAGDRAYKLKKAVRLPYLDFSTIEKREEACRLELSLNRRLAPGSILPSVRCAQLTKIWSSAARKAESWTSS